MTFAWPHLLWLLLAPATLLVWQLTHRRRTAQRLVHPKILRAEAGANSLSLVSASPSSAGTTSSAVRPWLAIGLACAIVALARPQWGRIEEPVFDQSREILLAIDLSRSMLAPDVKPSRLDRAKLLIQSLLEKLEGERVGLVVFSGTAFLQSPLSSDYEILREFLPSLDTDFLPQGGSNYAAMLETAIQAFSTSTADRFLIVLSDGESTEPEWRAQLPALKEKSIRVLSLGIGTAAGSMLPDGSGGFVKDERGAVVLSRLESETLQELARATDGVYRDASTWVDLAELVRETIAASQTGEFVEKNTVRLVERFQWPLALALWCFLISLCYEFPVRPRPRDIRLAGVKTRTPNDSSVASSGTTVVALLALVFASGFWPLSSVSAATATTPPPTLPSPLARIVGRLADAPVASARDWAELARETVTWGSRLQSEQQDIPEGPVRDALHAVDVGEKEDPKTADWPKLREELEALLKKPEDEQQEQQKQDQNQSQDQNQDQQDQNQQQKKSSDDQNQKQSAPQKSDPQNQESPQQQSQDQNTSAPEQQPPQPGESAFGDMNEKSEAPPPPPPGEMQKVGGAPEKKDQPPENANPALAVPLQKLDQLRNQDSPARLFELMQGEQKSDPKKPGKDW